MPVSVEQIRDHLLPGLQAIAGSYRGLPPCWEEVFTKEASGLFVPAAPAIIPSVPAVLAMGAAAAVIKNPVIERRAFVGWMKGLWS